MIQHSYEKIMAVRGLGVRGPGVKGLGDQGALGGSGLQSRHLFFSDLVRCLWCFSSSQDAHILSVFGEKEKDTP